MQSNSYAYPLHFIFLDHDLGLFTGTELLILAVTMSCGSSPRRLVSMTLSPAMAAGHDYPDGQVQFSARGNYNHAPLTAPIQPALWVVVIPQKDPAATISENGLAKCGAAVGNFQVIAYAVTDPALPQTNENLTHAAHVAIGIRNADLPIRFLGEPSKPRYSSLIFRPERSTMSERSYFARQSGSDFNLTQSDVNLKTLFGHLVHQS